MMRRVLDAFDPAQPRRYREASPVLIRRSRRPVSCGASEQECRRAAKIVPDLSFVPPTRGNESADRAVFRRPGVSPSPRSSDTRGDQTQS